VIAISGGGAGIGWAIAWHFARRSYGVSIIDADCQAGKVSLEVMRVAKACQFIAEDAGFTTGQNLVLDGGMMAKMIYV
jgi:NAD(P)-dependent dehydrogenase (short-subunit alcohol dehydrogenase family)